MMTERKIVDTINSIKLTPSRSLDRRVLKAIDQALTNSKRRPKMTSILAKMAAAAVVVTMTATFAIFMMHDTISFARVIDPLLKERPVSYELLAGEDPNGPVLYDVVVGNRIRRKFSNMDIQLIMDLDAGQMLALEPANKTGIYIGIEGQVAEGTAEMIRNIRQILQQIQQQGRPAKHLGHVQVDGQQTIGYLVQDQGVDLYVYANPRTALAVRIELHSPKARTILRKISFDLPEESTIITMDLPEGYTIKQTNIEMGSFQQEDLIECFRIWATYLNDGAFPDQIRQNDLLRLPPILADRLSRQTGIDEQEAMEACLRFSKGLGFLQLLYHNGRWGYAGTGVRLGQATRAVFWYRWSQDEPYTVIFGDLHVQQSEQEPTVK